MSAPERFEFESGDGLAIAFLKWGNSRDVRGVVGVRCLGQGALKEISSFSEVCGPGNLRKK